jgi:adenylate cyclase
MRGVTTQNLRLVSGLVLFAFAATHFLNHAVGLFSLEAMDEVQEWRLAVTRSWPGMVVLGAALLTHVVLALAKTLRRGTLRLPAWELAQLATGLAIPFLLLPHIIDTHVANALFGVQDSYLYALAWLWPAGAWTQSVLLLLVWSHACLGLHYWLKFDAWYQLTKPLWVVLAVAIPMAALMGFVVSGRFVAALLADPAMAERMRSVTHWPDVAEAAWLALYEIAARIGFAIVLAAVAVGVAFRQFNMLAAPKIAISYAGGEKIQSAVGPTLLEISRNHGLMHVAECGGRARCGLCRVRIDEGHESLAPPDGAERATLAPFNPTGNVRLACQIRPTAPLVVTRLVSPGTEPVTAAVSDGGFDAGTRRPLCLLYVHLREFDAIARDRLPYDLVFLMNEFFGAVGQAVEGHSGRVDHFLGDAVLAVFGEQRGLEQGCKDAVDAARALDLALDRVNEKVAAEIGRPMQASMGMHAGELVLGRVAFGQSARIAVLGVGADLPARLAAVAYQKSWQLALSMEVARSAGLNDAGAHHRAVLAAKGEAGAAIELVGVVRCRDIATGAMAELPTSTP